MGPESYRVTTQVDQPHPPEGGAYKEPPTPGGSQGALTQREVRVGGLSADIRAPGQEGLELT